MFKIEKHKVGKFDAVRLINDSSGEYLEVLTEFGAGLNDLVFKNAQDQLISILDGYHSEEEIIHDHHTAFKGSKLSPFPNRIVDGRYKFDDKTYQLPINEVGANNTLHAFLHSRPFKLIRESAGEQAATVHLEHIYRGTDQGYPFPYHLILIYKLTQDGVSVQTEIKNLGSTTLPMGDGWHPYFRFENLNTVQMQMGTAHRISSNFGNQSTTHGFEHSQTIGELKLDDCFSVNGAERFSVKLKDPKTTLEIEVWQESLDGMYKYVQIYTPPSRTTIAIEPVTCAPNAINTGLGLIILKPNEKVSMSFGIKNILNK